MLFLSLATPITGSVPQQDPLPLGRSYLDRLLSVMPGTVADNLRDFKRLTDNLKKISGSELAYTLIPIGRSLQRLDAFPFFFEKPRIVVAYSGNRASIPSESMDLRHRLFLAYSFATHQMEAISFNDEDGRYEFQIAKHVGEPGKTAELFYASRRTCLACHQQGMPIFPQAPWSETTINRFLTDILLKKHPAGRFLGFQIQNTSESIPGAVVIDGEVRLAEQPLLVAQAWSEVCGRLDSIPEVVRCRALLLKIGVASLVPVYPTHLEEELKSIVRKERFRSLRFSHQGTLSDREPFSNGTPAFSRNGVTSVSRPANENDVDLLVRNARNLPRSLNPVTSRYPARLAPADPDYPSWLAGALDSEVSGALLHDFTNLRTSGKIDTKMLLTSVDAESELALTNADSPLRSPFFNRQAAVRNILARAFPGESKRLLPKELPDADFTKKRIPLKKEDPRPGISEILVSDPNLALVFRYCSSCHAGKDSSEAPGFLFGLSEREVSKRVVEWKPRILEKLRSEQMPPSDSREAGELLRDENQGARSAIIKYVEGLQSF